MHRWKKERIRIFRITELEITKYILTFKIRRKLTPWLVKTIVKR